MTKYIADASNCILSNDRILTVYISEASQLRFPVGRCPKVIETKFGNGLPFRLTNIIRDSDGEAIVAVFMQDLGCVKLEVFNT